MRELLRELRDMGKTIILSSHILSELADLCDLVGIMEKGHLVASAPLDDIRRRIHPERHLQIKLLTDPQTAVGMISGLSGVKELSSEDNRIDILFSGDESAAADLLDTLVNLGIRISAFEEVKSDLEEIYLQLTTGEVS
jgi:ABC-2 type transport system ATP-binding protein